MTLQQKVKEQLTNEYKYRIEMHAHTSPASPCSHILPEEMVETYSELRFDAVVIANHFIKYILADLPKNEAIDRYLKDFEDTCAAAEKCGLKILLAAEVRFDENINDYLLYGVDRSILETVYDYFPKGIKAFREEVSLENSVFLQAHPFRDGMELVDAKLLDGIETFNVHPGHNSRIGQAAKYAKVNNLEIKIAGTDYHHPNMGHEGLSAVRTRILPKDSFELAKILKEKDYVIEIGADSIVLP